MVRPAGEALEKTVASKASWPTVTVQAVHWSDTSQVVAPWVMLIVAFPKNVDVAILIFLC
jgi:hypothetical protein